MQGVTLNITSSSRIALLGPNGAGKSTLLKLLSGQLQPNQPAPGFRPKTPKAAAVGSSKAGGGVQPLVPTKKQLKAAKGLAVDAKSLPSAQAAAAAAACGAGSVERAAVVKVALFGQHSVEELQVDESALQRLTAHNPSLFTQEQDACDYLGSYGLGGKPSTQCLRSLSGGQKARAALALLLANPPHILLLDEPTNHLDLNTVEALVRAIKAYSGAVVVASHDIRFVAEIVGQKTAAANEGQASASSTTSVKVEGEDAATGEVYVIGKGGMKLIDVKGGVMEYTEQVKAKVLKKQGGLLQLNR
eukprot:GHRR01025624.1.p1 GENE.GHRR01025624.1~~GHRR01025624.1.p1  ORF type:complete len:303 (+),score=116.45 GHRR01025624.1:362-1270(+)